MDVDRALVKVVLQQEDIKVRNQDQDIPRRLDLKEVRCLCKDVFPSMGLKILTVRSIKVLISVLFRSLLKKISLKKIDIDTLISAGLISKNTLVKILGKGTLEKKLEVHAHAFSKSAIEAIEAKEGTAVKL